MRDAGTPNNPSDELQFQTAELAQPAGATQAQPCSACGLPIADAYYAMDGKLICPTCREQMIAPLPGSKVGRLVKSSLLGMAAGLGGAIAWFAIRRLTGFEIGLVAILVGLAVGAAVRKGSSNRGGRGYQIIAVLITYCSIAANYMPDIFEGLVKAVREREAAAAAEKAAPKPEADAIPPDAAAPDVAAAPAEVAKDDLKNTSFLRLVFAVVVTAALVFAFSLAIPFMGGAENLIGILIIGFALWEAWKMNAQRGGTIVGPYYLAPQPNVPAS